MNKISSEALFLCSKTFTSVSDMINYIDSSPVYISTWFANQIVSPIIDGNFFVYKRLDTSVIQEPFAMGFVGANGEFRVVKGTLGNSIEEVVNRYKEINITKEQHVEHMGSSVLFLDVDQSDSEILMILKTYTHQKFQLWLKDNESIYD